MGKLRVSDTSWPWQAGDSSGNAHVSVQSDYRGDFPETWYTNSTATAAAATDNALVVEINVESYEGIVFQCTTANVTVQASLDGTNYSGDLYFEDLTALDATATNDYNKIAATVSTEICRLRTPFKTIKFLNSGAAAATIRYGLVGKMGAA